MKISQVLLHLEGYDKNKGIKRRVWKPEEHAEELREFCKPWLGKKTYQNRELTSKEQLRLVNIILSIEDVETNIHEAATTFRLIANHLGGIKPLLRLKASKLLTETNLMLLEKCQLYAEPLSQFIVLVSKAMPSEAKLNLPKIVESINLSTLGAKLPGINALLDKDMLDVTTLNLMLGSSEPDALSEVLLLLQKKDLAEEENIQCLPEVGENLSYLSKILSTLCATDSALLEQENLTVLLKLNKSLKTCHDIINELSQSRQLTQLNLNKVFAHAKGYNSEIDSQRSLLLCFRKFNWNIEENLDAILSCDGQGFNVHLVARQLNSLPLNSSQLKIVLDALFKAPKESDKVLAVVAHLLGDFELVREDNQGDKLKEHIINDYTSKKKAQMEKKASRTQKQNVRVIDEEDLKTVLSVPAFSPELAMAIKALNHYEVDKTKFKEIIAKFPEHTKNLSLAVSHLYSLPLDAEHRKSIEKILFATPQFSFNVINGVKMLLELSVYKEEVKFRAIQPDDNFEPIDGEDLNTILKFPAHSFELARVIKSFNKEADVKKFRTFVIEHPKLILGFAAAISLLEQGGQNIEETRERLFSKPRANKTLAGILQSLFDAALFNKENSESLNNFHFLYEHRLVNENCSRLLVCLQKTGILTQANFELLDDYSDHIHLIAEACESLIKKNIKLLNQENFEMFLENYKNPQNIAKLLIEGDSAPEQQIKAPATVATHSSFFSEGEGETDSKGNSALRMKRTNSSDGEKEASEEDNKPSVWSFFGV